MVSTEDWLPDILMYSHDGNFMKYKEPKDSTTLMDQTIKEFEAYILQTQSEFKKMLAKAVKQFKDIRAWELEKIKEEGVDLGTGAYTIPHLTKSILVDSTLDTFGGKFGLCKVNWNEGSAYSELLTSGQGRCWPIVPLVAKYLSIRQFSNQYKDLTLNWSKWTYFRNIERLDFQSKLDIKKLFYYLGDSDNLRYLNNGVKMPATAFDRIPQTLHNFGLTTTCTVDTEMGFVEQVIFDNGDYQRPTLLQYEIKTGNDTYVRQAIIDGQKIITRKFQCSYSNSTEQVKYCYQYFYHFNYGRDEMNINGYFNWGIFCPTVFREALPAMNPFYAPIPQINTNVRHLKVINTGEIDY